MEPIFILLAIAVFVLNIVGKKKQAEQKKAQEAAKRRAAEQAAEAGGRPMQRAERGPLTTPQPTVRTSAYSPDQPPDRPARQRQQPPPQPRQTYRQPQPQRSAADPRFFDDTAAPTRPAPRRYGEGESGYGNAPAAAHTVRPLTETSHRHMETSATGIVECDPADVAANVATVTRDTPEHSIGLALDVDSMAAAVLYAEILGKPKALRIR